MPEAKLGDNPKMTKERIWQISLTFHIKGNTKDRDGSI
jgi:hypothetical protein